MNLMSTTPSWRDPQLELYSEIASDAYKKALAAAQFDLLIKLALAFQAMIDRNPNDKAAKEMQDEIFSILGEAFPVFKEKNETDDGYAKRKEKEQYERKKEFLKNLISTDEDCILSYEKKKNQFVIAQQQLLSAPHARRAAADINVSLDTDKKNYSEEKTLQERLIHLKDEALKIKDKTKRNEFYNQARKQFKEDDIRRAKLKEIDKEIEDLKKKHAPDELVNLVIQWRDSFSSEKFKEKFTFPKDMPPEQQARFMEIFAKIAKASQAAEANSRIDMILDELLKGKSVTDEGQIIHMHQVSVDENLRKIESHMKELQNKEKIAECQAKYAKLKNLFIKELYQPAFADKGAIARQYDIHTIAFLIQTFRTLDTMDSLVKKGSMLDLVGHVLDEQGTHSKAQTGLTKILQSRIEGKAAAYVKKTINPELSYLDDVCRAIGTSSHQTTMVLERTALKTRMVEKEEKMSVEEKKREEELARKKLARKKQIQDWEAMHQAEIEQLDREDKQGRERWEREKELRKMPLHWRALGRTSDFVSGTASSLGGMTKSVFGALYEGSSYAMSKTLSFGQAALSRGYGAAAWASTKLYSNAGKLYKTMFGAFEYIAGTVNFSVDFANALSSGNDMYVHETVINLKLKLADYTTKIFKETLRNLNSLNDGDLIKSPHLKEKMEAMNKLSRELDRILGDNFNPSDPKFNEKFEAYQALIKDMRELLISMGSHNPPFDPEENTHVISLITLMHGAMAEIKSLNFSVFLFEKGYEKFGNNMTEYKTLQEEAEIATGGEPEMHLFHKAMEAFGSVTAAEKFFSKIDKDVANQMQALNLFGEKLESSLKTPLRVTDPKDKEGTKTVLPGYKQQAEHKLEMEKASARTTLVESAKESPTQHKPSASDSRH